MLATINRAEIRNLLYAESTNASRTAVRDDGVSEFESIVIDRQADNSLVGSWMEATSRLAERMHEFLNAASRDADFAKYDFKKDTPDGLLDNIKMYIVDYMMGVWLSHVRPEQQKQYAERAAIEMDDILRKLYKKEPPV